MEAPTRSAIVERSALLHYRPRPPCPASSASAFSLKIRCRSVVSALHIRSEARDSSTKDNREMTRRSNGGARIFKFYQADGEEVLATVTKGCSSYKVSVVIHSKEDNLCMHWNIFRSRSSDWRGTVLKDFLPGTTRVGGTYRSMLEKVDACLYNVQLELGLSYAPFFMEFKVFQATNEEHEGAPSREASRESCFVLPVGCGRGHPDPLGTTVQRNGYINFALYSKHAAAVVLCLYHAGSTQPSVELELHSSINRTGSTWHIELDGSTYDRYGYRCMGESSWDKGNRFHARRILLDPYAKTVAPTLPGQESLPSPAVALGLLLGDKMQFDWGDDVHPDIPLEELIVYRLNVTGFTADVSSALRNNVLGTFEGLLAKAQHFKSLGVNCIILQPVFFLRRGETHIFL